jgi:plastocyanin
MSRDVSESDTVSIAAGATVTWTWNESGTPHGIQSTGSPSFASETGTQSTNGATYKVTFTTAGTYTYNCSVHLNQMTGRVVVRP